MKNNQNKIKIVRCYNSIVWYNQYIGDTFSYYREYDDSYLVRTPEGTSNIVYKIDCEKVKEVV